jgi:hypothetical protein
MFNYIIVIIISRCPFSTNDYFQIDSIGIDFVGDDDDSSN